MEADDVVVPAVVGQPAVAEMSYPVRCAYCHRVYDLGTVTVTARYSDCSVWNAPCCGVTVDDRGDTGWKSTKDYHRIDKGVQFTDPYGVPWMDSR